MSAITDDQRTFILCFVVDGEYDLGRTCTQLGFRPSKVHAWFRDKGFQAALKQTQAAKLQAMGYGALLAMEDTLGIAHSDISQVSAGADEGLSALPRHVRIAIKTVEYAIGFKANGDHFTYPKKIVMHDKSWALLKAAEWFQVAEVVRNGGIQADDGVKRAAGLVVRPPITKEDSEAEELLRV